jgi:hypothetical protein
VQRPALLRVASRAAETETDRLHADSGPCVSLSVSQSLLPVVCSLQLVEPLCCCHHLPLLTASSPLSRLASCLQCPYSITSSSPHHHQHHHHHLHAAIAAAHIVWHIVLIIVVDITRIVDITHGTRSSPAAAALLLRHHHRFPLFSPVTSVLRLLPSLLIDVFATVIVVVIIHLCISASCCSSSASQVLAYSYAAPSLCLPCPPHAALFS